MHLARTRSRGGAELSPFRFLKAITKVTSRTESFLAGKRKCAIMQWKRQFPVVLSRRSVSPPPPRRTAARAATFCRKTDGKFRGPDTPTFNARRSRSRSAHSARNLRIDSPFVVRSTSAKPTTQLKTRAMNEYKLLW